MLSIQQSGLIGEQFLEITPPRSRSVYIPVVDNSLILNNADVEVKLDEKYYTVGKVKKSQIMSSKIVPQQFKECINTPYAYKIDYIVNLPGLILPPFMTGSIVSKGNNKVLRIVPLDKTPLPYPQQTSPYTILEPMRIAEFMDLQYKAAESLTETNRAVNELLNDSMIAEIRQSVTNFKNLTAQATTTLAKTEKLVDTSRNDIDTILWLATDVANNFNKLSTNINGIIGDEQFKPALYTTLDSFNQISEKLTPIIGAIDAKAFAEDLNAVMKNLNEISTSVNQMTKDEKLKQKITLSIDNLNKALCEISQTLETVNGKNDENLKEIIKNTSETVSNLKKFSEKLNKRFLLFRLLF